MVHIVRLAGLGRRMSAAVPALVLATGGVAFAGALVAARGGLDVPDQALTGGASPRYPSAGDAPAPMQLPPVYDTYTSDPARQAVPAEARAAVTAIGALLPVRLDAHGIPAPALTAYHQAADLLGRSDPACGLDWALLAAIGRVESNHARFGGNGLDAGGVARPGIIGIALDGSRGTARISDTDGGRWDRDGVYDRAVGPMQFIPGTWRGVGADGDGDGVRNPQDMADAASAAGVYLCSGSGDLRRSRDTYDAVLRYNHSDDYVRTVMNIANAYRNGVEVLPVGALPAARPASGSGTQTPEGSGFAWSGGEPAPAPSASSTTTAKPAPTSSGTSGPAPVPSTARPAPAQPQPPKPALPSPRLPKVPVPTVPLPSPTAPAPTPTTLTVAQLLALPHLPPVLGDPAGLVRVLSPLTGEVVCVLDEKVVTCP
jgi:membrane-bound lytic murein transglycosylase B